MRSARLSASLATFVASASLLFTSSADALEPGQPPDLASARYAVASARAIEKSVHTKARGRVVDAALRDYRKAAAARVAELRAELKSLPRGPATFARAKEIAKEMRTLGASPSYSSTPVYVPEVEPNDSPGTATFLDTFNSTVVIAQGTQGQIGDHDYYRITAPAGSRVWAYVTNPDDGGGKGGGDTQLYLYQSDGTTLIEYDDDDGTGNNLDSTIESDLVPSIASAPLTAGGTYYLDVAYFEDSGAVSGYLLFVVVQTGPGVDEVEPNNSIGEAMPLLSQYDSWNTPPVGRLGVVNGTCQTSQEDEDYYHVYLQPGNILYVALDGDPERDLVSNDFTVEILDSKGTQLLLMDSSDTVSYGNTPVSEAGALAGYYSDLYIHVTPFGGGGGKRAGRSSDPSHALGGTGIPYTYRLLVAVANDMPLCVSQTSSWVSNLGDFYSSFGVPGYFDATHMAKLVRDGNSSSCAPPKACPGLDDGWPTQAQLYPLRNNTDQPQCIAVTVQLSNGNECVLDGEQIFVAAYGEEYDPLIDDACASYLGDLGSSPVDTTPRTFSVTMPPRSWTWIVFYDMAGQLSCPQDVLFSVSGLPPGCVADVGIQKTGPETSPVGPGPVSYDITVQNFGPMSPPAWEFADTVPAGFQLTAISSPNPDVRCVDGFSSPSFPVAAGTLIECYLLGPVPVGSITTVTFTYDTSGVANGACVTNTAALEEPHPPIKRRPDGDSPGHNDFAYTDPNSTNDSSSALTCFGNGGDLALWKLDGDGKGGGPDPVAAGRELTYTLRIVNPGPRDAVAVAVVDDLRAVTRINPPHEGTTVPLRFKAVRKPPVGDWTCTTPYPGTIGVVECKSQVLPPGIHDIGLVVTVPPICSPPGNVEIRNWATLTAATDTDPFNNVAFQDTLVLADPCFGVGGGPN